MLSSESSEYSDDEESLLAQPVPPISAKARLSQATRSQATASTHTSRLVCGRCSRTAKAGELFKLCHDGAYNLCPECAETATLFSDRRNRHIILEENSMASFEDAEETSEYQDEALPEMDQCSSCSSSSSRASLETADEVCRACVNGGRHEFSIFQSKRYLLKCTMCKDFGMEGAVFQQCVHCSVNLCLSCYESLPEQPELEDDIPKRSASTRSSLSEEMMVGRTQSVKHCQSASSELSLVEFTKAHLQVPGQNMKGIDSVSTAAGSDEDDMRCIESDMVGWGTSSMGCSGSHGGQLKSCSLCSASYSGFGKTCSACRKFGRRGSSRQCHGCGCYYQGFGAYCGECVHQPIARQSLWHAL